MRIRKLDEIVIIIIYIKSKFAIMGGTFSEPIPNVGDVGYVAIVVLQHDKLRLLHCPPNVREMVHNTIR